MVTRKITLLFLIVFQTSCSRLPTQETPTPRATATSVPTATPTVAATETIAPTLANLITTMAVVDGFTISIPFPLIHRVDGNIILIGDEEKILNISFVGDEYDNSPLETMIDYYLSALEKRGWQFVKSKPVEIEIDGVSGVSVDLMIQADGMNFEGQALAASPRPDFVLFGLGIAKIDTDENMWKDNGRATLETLIQSIQFTDPVAGCTISTDDTYGYSVDNPIKVGGDSFTGPSRERAYLDHLLGPNGESLTYERSGSIPSDTTILDAYRITGTGIDVELYLDEYNYSPVQAPVGFTCAGEFPFSAP